MSQTPYDAILLVSFGGPERREDVIPFLENVLRGRNVPHERMLAVAEHYYHFDGVSPINEQNRQLIAALEQQLPEHGIHLPIYWGNRNWHPMLPDTIRQMAADGIQNALAFVTAAHSSYSGCRQYRQNLEDACAEAGENAPHIDKIRVFYNHPDFIRANASRVRDAIEQLTPEQRDKCELAFTAHSIPLSMADNCDYVKQLNESCRLVAEELQIPASRWKLVYQSRSGRPQDPWLEPDVLDHLRELRNTGRESVIIVPIGFLSDHMEVLYDLEVEARDLCQELGLQMQRAGTVGTHPDFVKMVCKLISERMIGNLPREAIGHYGPNWDECQTGCCPAFVRR